MTVTSVRPDAENLTMTIETRLAATPERAWRLWSDPRQLERWWGPPTHPATVTDHDLSPGGHVAYYMTGPEGERYHGWWRVIEVTPPGSLEFQDGFADEDGSENADMPTTVTRVTLVADGQETIMTIMTIFPSLEAMEQLLEMGAAEGMRQALSQIGPILTEDAT
jgi:uncharacterized protein YndB with AHSA1/START domain